MDKTKGGMEAGEAGGYGGGGGVGGKCKQLNLNSKE